MFKEGETDSRMKKIFEKKCRLGYQTILDKRSDIRMRFGLLLDAGIAELSLKDIEYLGEIWAFIGIIPESDKCHDFVQLHCINHI